MRSVGGPDRPRPPGQGRPCVAVDGFVETPSRSLDWVLIDEELHSFF
jgi:hypothetical protein